MWGLRFRVLGSLEHYIDMEGCQNYGQFLRPSRGRSLRFRGLGLRLSMRDRNDDDIYIYIYPPLTTASATIGIAGFCFEGLVLACAYGVRGLGLRFEIWSFSPINPKP